MKVLRNEKGLSLVVLLLALVIVLILATVLIKKMYSNTNKALQKSGVSDNVNSPSDAKNKAYGSVCNQTIVTISTAVEQYRVTNGALPQSIDQILEVSPEFSASINDKTLWVEDGEPRYTASVDGTFVLDGYCVDGNVYTFSSTSGTVTSKPY